MLGTTPKAFWCGVVASVAAAALLGSFAIGYYCGYLEGWQDYQFSMTPYQPPSD
jgi:hypothetical protein